jgi:4-diphosphocytidyl-2-C-methyl-D-erythritol kinase
VVLNSYAKLNLYLEVINRRKDSYHNIKTLFERINLCDIITLKARQDKIIKITSNSADIPKDATNLAYKSAKILQDSFRVNRGVEIKINKRIPVGSGMGGGSSNAAVVLCGLNRFWKLNLSRAKLVSLGKKIGSDVPFFIYDCAFALGGAKGDVIKPLSSLKGIKLWHVLVVPKIKVSTPLIYRKWDKNSSNLGLTRPAYNVNILPLALKKKDLALLGSSLFNSLEAVTAKIYPELKKIRAKLGFLGVRSILMSGSGPTMFGITSSRKEAVFLYRRLRKEKFWQVFVTRTL